MSSVGSYNFKVFLIEFGFAVVGCNGEPVFDEKTMHQTLNLDAICNGYLCRWEQDYSGW
jgi:hypothetical protein